MPQNKPARLLSMNDISKKQSLVVKSNHLIEASYRLTTQEQRIVLILSSMVKLDDKDFHRYKIEVKEFNRLVGIENEGGYTRTKETTKKLLERVLIIKNPQEKKELQIGWLASAEYFEGEGFVELEFSPKLKPYLLALKECFTQYQLKNVIALKRSYSIRIYELLKQYEKIGERYFEVDQLKRILGIKDDQYKLYGDFKRKIIKPAEKELKSKTDIYFNFKEKKNTRKVIGLYFFIKRHEKEAKDQKTDDINIEIYMKMKEYFCLSPIQAKEFLNKYPESQIVENLQHVERRQKLGQIKDIGAYTAKAIANDYKDQLTLFDVEKQQEQKIKDHKEAEKWLLEDLKVKYRTFRLDEHEKLKKQLSGGKLKALDAQAEAEATEKAKGKKIAIKAYKSPALQKLYDLEAKIPPEHEWIEQQLQNIKTEKQG